MALRAPDGANNHLVSTDLFIGPESDHWLLTHWLTDSLLFSKLDWCDPGVWRCKVKTCWGCYWLLIFMLKNVWIIVWYRFGRWSFVINLIFVQTLTRGFSQDFKVEARRGFEAEVLSVFCCWCWFFVFTSFYHSVFISLSVCLSSVCLSICLSVCLSACLSIFLTSCWHSEQLLFW